MPTDLIFSINTGSSEPIYRQLVEQVRRRIAAGQLSAGQEIPSVRELAHAEPSASRVELLRPTLEKAASESRQLELTSPQALKLFQQILNEGEKP
jgi:GntR family transcriptional regulator